MPIYVYVDKKTDFKVEVIRDFADYEVVPKDDELPEAERGKEREWERLIGEGIKTVKGHGWGGKGYW